MTLALIIIAILLAALVGQLSQIAKLLAIYVQQWTTQTNIWYMMNEDLISQAANGRPVVTAIQQTAERLNAGAAPTTPVEGGA